MIDFRKDIKTVCNVHGKEVSETETEEINNALNDLVADYMVNDGTSETDALGMISDDFWDFVRELLD